MQRSVGDCPHVFSNNHDILKRIMNHSQKAKLNPDVLAYLVIVLPLVAFFAIVGFGTIADQRRLSHEFHAKLSAETSLPELAEVKTP